MIHADIQHITSSATGHLYRVTLSSYEHFSFTHTITDPTQNPDTTPIDPHDALTQYRQSHLPEDPACARFVAAEPPGRQTPPVTRRTRSGKILQADPPHDWLPDSPLSAALYVRTHPHDPGCYPLLLLMGDTGVLCHDCVNEHWSLIFDTLTDPDSEPQDQWDQYRQLRWPHHVRRLPYYIRTLRGRLTHDRTTIFPSVPRARHSSSNRTRITRRSPGLARLTRSSNMKIKVSAPSLAAVRSFQAKKAPRQVLNGILLERPPNETPGCFVAASDGHRMAVIYDEHATIESDVADSVIVAVDKPVLTRLAKRDTLIITLEESPAGLATTGALECGDILTLVTRVEGRFPAWRNVIPRPHHNEPEGKFGLDPTMLKAFAELFPHARGYQSVAFRYYATGQAILATSETYPHRFGVLMPTRETFGLPKIPGINFIT